MEVDTVSNTRLRRSNDGTRVERIQMDFSGNCYGAKRQINFVIYRAKVHPNSNKKEDSFMKIDLEMMFTQMNANSGIHKFSETTVSAMIKEFTQLNEGVVPGKPVVFPMDSRTLAVIDKKKALPVVNLIKKWNGVMKGR